MESETVSFTRTVAAVAEAARRRGLAVPYFRSRPAGGLQRSMRRTDQGILVAITVHGRPFADVAVDVIEAVLVANGLRLDDLVIRRELLSAVDSLLRVVA